MHLQLRLLFKKISSSRSSTKSSTTRRDAITKYSYDWRSSEEQVLSINLTRASCISSPTYDWETLDDQETTAMYNEPLAGALRGSDTFDLVVLASISRKCSTDYILHEAITLSVPDNLLFLLVERFPILLTEVNSNGRYPVHVACSFGTPSEFVSRCIDANPSSAAVKDNEGQTHIHLLCKQPRTMKYILWVFYRNAPSSIVSEDSHGLECLEYALESNLGINLILTLQEMIGYFYEKRGSCDG
ncbi:hypothetical protein ACHAXR_011324 [Thalassiosira sp. AJA248-18]